MYLMITNLSWIYAKVTKGFSMTKINSPVGKSILSDRKSTVQTP